MLSSANLDLSEHTDIELELRLAHLYNARNTVAQVKLH